MRERIYSSHVYLLDLERRNWIDEKEDEFEQVYDDIQRWSVTHNKYLFCQTKRINLLLMGKRRTGKSTIAHVIANPCYLSKEAQLYSPTKQITIHSVSTREIEAASLIYSFNIIDTPGFFSPMKSSKNLSIKATIEKCLEEDITKIHLFAFVIDIQSYVDDQDIESMNFLLNRYPFLKSFLCLIVTHCEETTDQQRARIIEEFFQSENVKKNHFEEIFAKKIFFMGTLRSQSTYSPHQQVIRKQIQTIHQMRQQLIQHLIQLDSEHFFNINQIQASHRCHLL